LRDKAEIRSAVRIRNRDLVDVSTKQRLIAVLVLTASMVPDARITRDFGHNGAGKTGFAKGRHMTAHAVMIATIIHASLSAWTVAAV
jgi:hypothetical protein